MTCLATVKAQLMKSPAKASDARARPRRSLRVVADEEAGSESTANEDSAAVFTKVEFAPRPHHLCGWPRD